MQAIRRFAALTIFNLLALALMPAIATAAGTSTFSGRCVAVSDGDTIKVVHNGSLEKIRLLGIDCPEKKQAFGMRAKQFTVSLAYGQMITVSSSKRDRYGRTLGDITLPDGRDLNAELVKHGYAWWYRKFSNDEHLHSLESAAQREHIGLWARAGAFAALGLPPAQCRKGAPSCARLSRWKYPSFELSWKLLRCSCVVERITAVAHMRDRTQGLNDTIVRGLEKLRTKGKNVFIIMFTLACMGVACDVILVLTALQWKTIAHMNDHQLSFVMGLDLSIIGVVLVLGLLLGRSLWRRMEEKYVTLTAGRQRQRVPLGGPLDQHEKN